MLPVAAAATANDDDDGDDNRNGRLRWVNHWVKKKSGGGSCRRPTFRYSNEYNDRQAN